MARGEDERDERRKVTSSSRHSHSQIRIHQSLPSGRDNRLFACIQIITSRESATSCWELSFLGKPLDQEVWAILHLGDWDGDVEWLGGGCWDHGYVVCGGGGGVCGLGALWEG